MFRRSHGEQMSPGPLLQATGKSGSGDASRIRYGEEPALRPETISRILEKSFPDRSPIRAGKRRDLATADWTLPGMVR